MPYFISSSILLLKTLRKMSRSSCYNYIECDIGMLHTNREDTRQN
jgi:hypothetical protein